MAEIATIARPYAVALFDAAKGNADVGVGEAFVGFRLERIGTLPWTEFEITHDLFAITPNHTATQQRAAVARADQHGDSRRPDSRVDQRLCQRGQRHTVRRGVREIADHHADPALAFHELSQGRNTGRVLQGLRKNIPLFLQAQRFRGIQRFARQRQNDAVWNL